MRDRKNVITFDFTNSSRFGTLAITNEDLERASIYRSVHKNHVNKLYNSTSTESCPTELEDIKNPELWKAEHWRWFINNKCD